MSNLKSNKLSGYQIVVDQEDKLLFKKYKIVGCKSIKLILILYTERTEWLD